MGSYKNDGQTLPRFPIGSLVTYTPHIHALRVFTVDDAVWDSEQNCWCYMLLPQFFPKPIPETDLKPFLTW